MTTLRSQSKDEDFKLYSEASALVAKMLSLTESALLELDTDAKGIGGHT
jgi:hypothetical protein